LYREFGRDRKSDVILSVKFGVDPEQPVVERIFQPILQSRSKIDLQNCPAARFRARAEGLAAL
jgi:hypothetical protein